MVADVVDRDHDRHTALPLGARGVSLRPAQSLSTATMTALARAMYRLPLDGSIATPTGETIEAGSGPGKLPALLGAAIPTTVLTTPEAVIFRIALLVESAT